MRLYCGTQFAESLPSGTACTIGNFDGLHRGHQALLKQLKQEAAQRHLVSTVILFEPQPNEYFLGKKAPARLMSLREKVQFLKAEGIDQVYCLRFNQHLANMSAHDFAQYYFFSCLNAKYLLIGEDFRFGKDRQGGPELLKEIAATKETELAVFPDYTLNDQRISSTQIRQFLMQGAFTEVADCLGRTYSLSGRVIQGAGLGRQWGIPTANFTLNRLILPLHGVFCIKAEREDGRVLVGVANIGTRPTVNGQKDRLEIYFFNFNESLYGERLKVYFLKKLRDEKKFDSIEALIAQIHRDIEMAQHWFNELHS